MKRLLPALLVACAATSAVAQQFLPADLDLFGDGIVKPVAPPMRRVPMIAQLLKPAEAVKPEEKPEPAGFAHGVVFHDGRQLRGELVAVTKTEVVWRRPDSDVPLRFPRDEVRRLVLRAQTPAQQRVQNFILPMGLNAKPEEEDPAPAPVTIKLPGGDWFHGDLRSVDGKKFTLQLASGLGLEIPREAIEWLYFSKKPAPASGFAGDPLALESWMLGNPAASYEVENGVLSVMNGNWIGRAVAPPSRFEVEFSMPKSDAQNTRRLWLQPFASPSPNSYTTGTVVLTFSPTKFTHQIYINQFDEKSISIPKDEPDGPTQYRVFYAPGDNRMVVYRNGKSIADVKLREEKEFMGPPAPNAANAVNAQAVFAEAQLRAPNSICFDSGGSGTFKLQSLRILPWDGTLPTPADAVWPQDLLSGETEEAKRGMLEALTENALTFGGESRPRTSGTFIRLAPPAAPAAPAGRGDALLMFGAQGELSAAELEIADGRVKCRTSLGANAELPVERLEVIAFSRRKAAAPAPADVLVFRNGDTLRGSLLAAGKDQRLRWRTSGGQDVALETTRIAGVRLESKGEVKAATGAIVELRNGDRLRGEMLGFDEQGVRLKHDLLGERTFEAGKLWNLFLNPKLVLIDAGSDPGALVGMRMQGVRVGNQNAPAAERVSLDGHFLQFGQAGNSYSAQEPFSHNFKEAPDRYELRAEVTDAGGSEPYVQISLSGNSGMPTLQASLYSSQLRIYAYNTANRGANGRVNNVNRTFALEGKLPELNSRRTLRLFVDTKLGTVDFLVNGVHIAKMGAQAADRAPGIGANFNLYAYVQSGTAVVLSDLAIRPWNGEVPKRGEEGEAVFLNNGDFAPGKPKGIKDGKLMIESPDGPLEVPLDRITSVRFGGAEAGEKAAARLRLRDGTILHVDDFHWEKGELQARSGALGEIKLPVDKVMELILAPSPIRFPKAIEPKKGGGEEEKGADAAVPGALRLLPALK